MKYYINPNMGTTLPELREILKQRLEMGVMAVTFEKTDGTERLMNCTLDPALMPEEVAVDLEALPSKPKRKPNLEVLPVFDIDLQEWRSFRVASVKSVEFES